MSNTNGKLTVPKSMLVKDMFFDPQKFPVKLLREIVSPSYRVAIPYNDEDNYLVLD